MKKFVCVLLSLLICLSTVLCATTTVFAQEADTLAVTVDGVTTNVKVGDTFTYIYTLSDMSIRNCEARVSYTGDKLSIVGYDKDVPRAEDEWAQSAFPIISSSVIFNIGVSSAVKFVFSNIDAYTFATEQKLCAFKFTATAAGEAEISMNMIEMFGSDSLPYVKKTEDGSVVMREYTYNEYMTYTPSEDPATPDQPQPTDEPTQEPTQEPTTEPTEEPTDEPTQEPTAEPTQEPTDEPTQEPTEKPTEEPTVDPATPDQPQPTVEPTDEPTQEPTDEPTQAPTEAPTQPPVVKVENIVTTPADTNIAFSFDAVEGATKYWVYKYDEATGEWSSVVSTTTNSVVLKKLTPDTTYQFKILYKASDGTISAIEDADLVEETTCTAVAVDNIEAVSAVTSVTITWDAVENAKKYWVYKATSEDGPFYIYNSSLTNSLTVRKLRPDTTYYFKVMVLTTTNGVESYSNVDDSPVIEVTTGSKSIITTAITDVTSSSVTISFPKFAAADKYWMLYSTTTSDTTLESEWTTVKSITDMSVTSYTFNGLDSNTTYYFTICARYTEDNGAVEVIYYIPVETKTLYKDDNFLTFTPVDDTTLTVAWPEDIGAQKAWVYVYDSTGAQVKVVSTTINSVEITKLEDMTNYTYALYVMDANGSFGFVTPQSGFSYQ